MIPNIISQWADGLYVLACPSGVPEVNIDCQPNLLQRGRAKARVVTVSYKVAAEADVISEGCT